MPTAILVDGGFFLKRYRFLRGNRPPTVVARDLMWMCHKHLSPRQGQNQRNHSHPNRNKLYRIFFYDCPPLEKRTQNPISKKAINFSKTETAKWRISFHNELRKKRKVALRLGYLNERSGSWVLYPDVQKKLFRKEISPDDLTEKDVFFSVQQKGVDIRIGVDIASMAYKRQVDQIILVSGDSDFVPAAKLARREGIDFILDPMWGPIRPDLHEHIDGLRSVFKRGREDQDTQKISPL